MTDAVRDEIVVSQSQQQLAENVRAYLEKTTDRRVTLEELCREFNYSGTYIKRCFRLVYGIPVATYGRRCRMKEACRLLRHTGHGVLEIAGMLGYENGSKFTSAFRKVIGVTPGVYRRMGDEEADRLTAGSDGQQSLA